MTSCGEHNPTVIHFTIDGRQGILMVADIAAAFHLLVILANSVDYMSRPPPQPWADEGDARLYWDSLLAFSDIGGLKSYN